MNVPISLKPACRPRQAGKPRAATPDEVALADLAKAIGHPVRIRILSLLLEHDACVCGDIAAEFDLAQSTVSQHLKQLKDAGLIQGEIDGPRVCYCIDRAVLKRLQVLVAGI